MKLIHRSSWLTPNKVFGFYGRRTVHDKGIILEETLRHIRKLPR